MRSKLVGTINGVLLASEPNPITDDATGEITRMTRYDLLLDCYVDELLKYFPFQQLPPSVSNHQAYILDTDSVKMEFFKKIPFNVPHQFRFVPLGKSNGKSGVGALKVDFVDASPLK